MKKWKHKKLKICPWMAADINLEPESVFKKLPKKSKDDDSPKEWPNGKFFVVGDSILNGIDEKLLLRKKIFRDNNQWHLWTFENSFKASSWLYYDVFRNTANELLNKNMALKNFIITKNKNCKVITSFNATHVCGSFVRTKYVLCK